MIAMNNTMVVSYINKQGDMVLLPTWSSSIGPIHVATLTGHSPLGQTHSELPECDLEAADHHGMESLSQDSGSDL